MKRVAMIGCGGIGNFHLKHLLQFKDVELAGFCDLLPERAENFAKQAGGLAFTDYKVMYEEVEPDMVFICIPPYCHGEIEFETIRRGIHFFVEKPVVLDLELGKKIRDEVKKAGLITAVGFQHRYTNLVEPLKSFINKHEIIYINCIRIGGVPNVFWWRKRNLSGGQIVEQTIHQFDAIRYYIGEPDTVYTMGSRGFIKDKEGYDTEDLSVTTVKFKNGILASISTGCYAESSSAADSKITFGTRNARADYYLANRLKIFGLKDKNDNKNLGSVVKGDGVMNNSEEEEFIQYKSNVDHGLISDRTFIDAVISGDASIIRTPYEEGLRTVAFTLACNKSMEIGMSVKVEID